MYNNCGLFLKTIYIFIGTVHVPQLNLESYIKRPYFHTCFRNKLKITKTSTLNITGLPEMKFLQGLFVQHDLLHLHFESKAEVHALHS